MPADMAPKFTAFCEKLALTCASQGKEKTFLIDAFQLNDLSLALKLLRSGVKLPKNEFTSAGLLARKDKRTPETLKILHVILDILIDQGMDVNMHALEKVGHREEDIPMHPGVPDIHLMSTAVFIGDVQLVQALLQRKANPNWQSSNIRFPFPFRLAVPPVFIAVVKTHVGVLRALIEEGHVDVNVRLKSYVDPTSNGPTPLIVAATHDCQDVVELLLEKGANPLVETVHGYTALKRARGNGDVQNILKVAEARWIQEHPIEQEQEQEQETDTQAEVAS
jgi:hypothetical protein